MQHVNKKQQEVLAELNSHDLPVGLATIAGNVEISQTEARTTLQSMPKSWISKTGNGRYGITSTGLNALTHASKQYGARLENEDYLAKLYETPSSGNGYGRR